MFNALQLVRNSTALARCVRGAMADFRGRERAARSNLSSAARADWLHAWCGMALRRLNIPVHVEGPLPQSGLIVSNHLSYLDILCFSAVLPAIFVSKSEVRDWPVFGALTTMAGTVYVDRKRRSDTRNANEGIRQALQQGLRVVIFPEGTSSDGSSVLPFYPSLFEPAVEAAVPITAAHIAYALPDGEVGRDIAYWGDMTFFPHLLNLLSKRDVSATVTFSPEARTFDDRKTAAAEMREVVAGLGADQRAAAP